MTRHERQLVQAVTAALGDALPDEAVVRLLELGLIDLRACERRAIRSEIDRLGRTGTPRCEAMHDVAERFCCSYEKVRGIFYDTTKF